MLLWPTTEPFPISHTVILRCMFPWNIFQIYIYQNSVIKIVLGSPFFTVIRVSFTSQFRKAVMSVLMMKVESSKFYYFHTRFQEDQAFSTNNTKSWQNHGQAECRSPEIQEETHFSTRLIWTWILFIISFKILLSVMAILFSGNSKFGFENSVLLWAPFKILWFNAKPQISYVQASDDWHMNAISTI